MGIGWTEIVLVLIVALVVLGPSKFPDAARKLGRLYREIRDAAGAVEREITRTGDDGQSSESAGEPGRNPPRDAKDSAPSGPDDPAAG